MRTKLERANQTQFKRQIKAHKFFALLAPVMDTFSAMTIGGIVVVGSLFGPEMGLSSGEMRLVLLTCMATIGSVSNQKHMNVILGKAGRNRWLGRRPRVRGVAMNPVDHPMGGGEGKASGGHPRSRKGLYSKGLKTRNKNKYSNKFIVKKRK